jgi:Dyp-type peroxidase family
MDERPEQIQSLLFGGMKRLSEAVLLLLRFRERPHQGLAGLLPHVSFGRLLPESTRAAQLALTRRGFSALGVPAQVFPFAFRDPLASAHHRRVLGDTGDSAPERWAWNGDEIDLALLLYAETPAQLEQMQAQLASPFELAYALRTLQLDESREHFGFQDGTSNPRLWGGRRDTARGEFVMGYPDETGETPPSPCWRGQDLGRDGSYLVLRQLYQDVEGFWAAVRERDPDPVRLAAKLVGRWPDGRPLTGAESFAEDKRGLLCPRGAHIRRANPRDALGSPTSPGPSVGRHRLLRRGRAYGPPAPPDVFPDGVRVTAGAVAPQAGADRGLLFACLCSDLARQFEHVQQSWLNNAKHDGLYDEVCPISSAGESVGDARRFSVPGHPVRTRLHDWPVVVKVRGTAYGMLPGRAALEALCAPPVSAGA